MQYSSGFDSAVAADRRRRKREKSAAMRKCNNCGNTLPFEHLGELCDPCSEPAVKERLDAIEARLDAIERSVAK